MYRKVGRGFALALCALLAAGLTSASVRQARAQEDEPHEGGHGGGFSPGFAIGVGVGVGRFIGEQMRRKNIEDQIERSIQRQKARRRRKTRETERVHVDVVRMQKCLLQTGFDPGPVDGDSGPKTKRAFRRFQEANGLGKRPESLDDEPSTEKLFAICEGLPDYGLVKAESDVAAPEPAGKETGKPLEGATVTSLPPLAKDGN